MASGQGAPASRAPADVEGVFVALADPTRRAVLDAVLQGGPVTASALAPSLGVTRQAVVKHLGVLRDAGLVHAAREGREVRFEADAAALHEAAAWLTRTATAWERRTSRLAARLGGAPPPP